MATAHLLEVSLSFVVWTCQNDNDNDMKHVQYSKSSKARCNGPPPCHGTAIDLGTLRYGQVSFGDYGEQVKWRHWWAVTCLNVLSVLTISMLQGMRYTFYSGATDSG